MHQPPILLRRSGSSITPAPGSGSSSSGGPSPGVGVGQVDPDNAIPIADEDPGVAALSLSSSHKRKQSGIPLDAQAIIRRTSRTHMLGLEQIRDEEEGGSGGELGGIQLSRSFSESDLSRSGTSGSGRQEDGSGGSSSMPEFSDIFREGEGGWSIKSLLNNRGMAGVVFLVMGIAFVTMRHTSTTAPDGSPAAAVGRPPAASAGGAEVSTPNNSPNPASKEITVGEYHEEITGTPLEHHVNEYNKIRFFDSPSKMKPMYSKGPVQFDNQVGGLHMFENVCLTNNIDALRYRPEPDQSLRGLIYFTDEKEIMDNPKRCVPCSNHQPLVEWEDTSHKDAKRVGHRCGMNGLHAMYASSVGDWTDCIQEDENTKIMEEFGQMQNPVNVSTIHFFQEPTFLLQFNALDMEKSLFDMLMTYLPHWDHFLTTNNDEDGGFPFDSVISHSLQGCLSHSHNWFCEVLHQMYAFGEAKEIPWESDDNTLYCYRTLFYNQPGYQRNLDHEGLVNKKNFGDFREMLFRKFGLPRRRTVEDRLAEKEEEGNKGNDKSDEDDTKIIFYDNKLSEERVWKEMDSLISKARELEKFSNIKFITVNKDFSSLSVAQQARKFNEADAVIMARGTHMANAIFAVDGTSFVEVGCNVDGPSLIGNPKFMELMDGKYRAVERCSSDKKDGDDDSENVCVSCKGEGDNVNFSMTPEAFEKLVDDVVASLER